jgi:hypothetical protein
LHALDSSSEWTLTADYAPEGGTGVVTGYVWVFPPPEAFTCPVFTYNAGGYFSPSVPTTNVEGSTDFTWTASNPNPNLTCSGYTPVSGMTFQGLRSSGGGIANKGNDTGSGTWTNSSGLSGPLSIETNLILTPTSEDLYLMTAFNPLGWGIDGGYETQLQIMQRLKDDLSFDPPDPNLNKFQGRMVYESATSPATDTCYDAAVAKGLGSVNPSARFAIRGSAWNVGWVYGENDDYGSEGVGLPSGGVTWYQNNIPEYLPCHASVGQAMTIANNLPGYSDNQFGTHTLSYEITSTNTTVTKDGVSLQRTWPQ